MAERRETFRWSLAASPFHARLCLGCKGFTWETSLRDGVCCSRRSSPATLHAASGLGEAAFSLSGRPGVLTSLPSLLILCLLHIWFLISNTLQNGICIGTERLWVSKCPLFSFGFNYRPLINPGSLETGVVTLPVPSFWGAT